jgi:hypothetical protein
MLKGRLIELEKELDSLIVTTGRTFYVMNKTDTGYEEFQQDHDRYLDGIAKVYNSVEDGYNAMVSNRNDVLKIAAHGVHTLTTMLTVSKSRCHFEGMDPGGRYTEQGTRIQTTVGAAAAAVIKVTGTRNSFKNIKFIQNDTNAAAINVAISAGSSTSWVNCSFIFEVTDNLDLTTATEVLCGEAGGTFRECVFGNDCILSSAARAVFTFDNVSGSATGDASKHCTFIDCLWTIMSSSASAVFVKVADTGALKFRTTFVNPVFHAVVNATNSAVILTAAFASVSGLVEGNILIVNPATNCTDLCTANNNVKVVGSSMNGGADTAFVGIGIVPD